MTKITPPQPSLIAQLQEPIVDHNGRMTVEFRQMLEDLAVHQQRKLVEAIQEAIDKSLAENRNE